ncbi:hypothetical protein [Mesorhizobium sp. M0809]|uniref:hypothetical protein n=1 Tax=Mesorhizobium sp. M0809 TaxID=2957003 RepID=UPI003338D8A3
MFRTWFQKLSDISSLTKTEMMFRDVFTAAVHELGFDSYAYLNIQPVGSYAVSNHANEATALCQRRGKTRSPDTAAKMGHYRVHAFAHSLTRTVSENINAVCPANSRPAHWRVAGYKFLKVSEDCIRKRRGRTQESLMSWASLQARILITSRGNL